jgi:hypothetical protein
MVTEHRRERLGMGIARNQSVWGWGPRLVLFKIFKTQPKKKKKKKKKNLGAEFGHGGARASSEYRTPLQGRRWLGASYLGGVWGKLRYL